MFQLKMSKIFFLLVMVSFLGSCVQYQEGYETTPQEKPEKHAQKISKTGPPAHAPAHGYRKKHTYKYYPHSKVYHSKEQDVYFWYKDGKWEFGVNLPGDISVNAKSFVELELESDKPYLHHEIVEKEHPGKGNAKGKYKKKNKGKYK